MSHGSILPGSVLNGEPVRPSSLQWNEVNVAAEELDFYYERADAAIKNCI